DLKTIDWLLHTLLDTNSIRPQDTIRWFVHLLRNRYARKETWGWLKENWDWVMDTFGGDKNYDDFARYSADVLSTTDQLQEYKDFFLPMTSQAIMKRTVELGIVDIEGRVKLIDRDMSAVKKALSELT